MVRAAPPGDRTDVSVQGSASPDSASPDSASPDSASPDSASRSIRCRRPRRCVVGRTGRARRTKTDTIDRSSLGSGSWGRSLPVCGHHLPHRPSGAGLRQIVSVSLRTQGDPPGVQRQRTGGADTATVGWVVGCCCRQPTISSKDPCDVAIVEPLHAQIKPNRAIPSFSRRALAAASAEWQLIAIAHNLLKRLRYQRTLA